MATISLFQAIWEVKNPVHYDLIEFLENVRDGYWYDVVTKCRDIKDKKERDAFKDKMPRVTFSGTFSYRNDSSLIEHSGLLAMDLDDIEDVEVVRKKLENDRYIYALFLSTSGRGLRPIFRIEPKKHQDAFKGIMQYLYKEYGLVCDTNSSLSKPYIVSFDPKLMYRMDIEDTAIFKKYLPETPVKQLANFVHTNDDFERIVGEITKRGISIAEDYNDYLKIGFAIASKYGENGRHWFHEICKTSAKYKAKDVDDQYKYCLRDHGTKKANISTFYYFAKQANISITSENTKIILRTTKTGRKAGLKKEQIADNLKKFNNIEDSLEVVSQIFDAHEEIDDDDNESILFQLEMFISNNYSLEMNEVTGFLEQNKKQLTAGDLNSIFIAAKKVIPVLDYPLMMRLLKSEFIPKYNPFFEFFESDGIPVILPPIPDKDQKPFISPIIDTLAQTIENEDPQYTLFFLRKWIVSIISAAHKVHSPLLLCFVGGQGTGKTEWLRRLLPYELQGYYAESKLDKEKDDEILMTENLVIMDDELGGKSKQDNIKLKNLTSKQYFSLRRPYADHNEKILRLAVLCGTSNTLQILSDSTGNRRIIPVEVINVNKELYNSIDKKALFLEAYRLYKEGFDWRITPDDVTYLNKDQQRFEMVVPERELIERYFSNRDRHRLTTTDIKVELEILTRQKLNSISIGRELEKLGFNRKTTAGGSGSKKWCIERINRGSDTIDETELQKNTF